MNTTTNTTTTTTTTNEHGDLTFNDGPEWAEAVRRGDLAWELKELMRSRSLQPQPRLTMPVGV